ncbi:hypothetical protein VTJ49DRAFT_1483 [Mycothermus thermophilus]|uniref:Uncharacterized protein n=1 Tax=Humicola insolens TaxID=85995 RepID=A0ABR3VCB1_HUMIN
MADRHTSSRAHPSGASRSRSGIPSTQSVRRNLFPSHLTRRQPAVSPPPEESSHFDTGLPKEQHQHHPGGSHHRHNGSFRTSSPSDIVVRDHNGEIELGDPPSPIVDEAEDAEAAEARHEFEMERQRLAEALRQHRMGQHGVPAHPEGKDHHHHHHHHHYHHHHNSTSPIASYRSTSPSSASSSSSSSSSNGSKCSETRLHYDHLTKTNQPPSAELLEAVKASLRARVAALEEDKWLYEPELPQRHQ